MQRRPGRTKSVEEQRGCGRLLPCAVLVGRNLAIVTVAAPYKHIYTTLIYAINVAKQLLQPCLMHGAFVPHTHPINKTKLLHFLFSKGKHEWGTEET